MLSKDEFSGLENILNRLTPSSTPVEIETTLWLATRLKESQTEIRYLTDLVMNLVEYMNDIQDKASKIEKTAMLAQNNTNNQLNVDWLNDNQRGR